MTRSNFPSRAQTTAAKAIVAAVGSTVTALTTMAATLSIVLGDDAVDAGEVGTVVTALVVFSTTVWLVWRVPNKPKL